MFATPKTAAASTNPLLPVAVLVAGMLAAAGCDRPRSPGGEGQEEGGAQEQPARRSSGDTLTIKGSDTMVILAQRWAEAFMAKHSSATVQVSGGGSGTGIAALINGTTTLANASRAMEEEEKEQLLERRNARAVEVPVALDAIAIYVHKDNPIASLSLEQLQDLFRGKMESWKTLGPDLGRVVLYSRENNSGTYAFFKEKVLDDLDFAPHAQTLPGTAAVIQAVSRDVRGIGYGGIGYAEGVRTVPIRVGDQQTVEATLENAVSGRYPLARNLFVYAAGEPEGMAERFLEFILGPDGQRLVEGVGYYPLPREDRAASVAKVDEEAAQAEGDGEPPRGSTAEETGEGGGEGTPSNGATEAATTPRPRAGRESAPGGPTPVAEEAAAAGAGTGGS